ncbi:glycosyltransferase involved in cell wall biosynthesis [Silvibacterium bohemicum]|uniref:Glycosyltransferase involved in cell wall biosynthesis n=1 Tax=Silvibacterium bohemicum TaxID=1577686 RepID=A0A841JQM3_9BACT|nr:glycosyltransferase [Silvibacterium bohemicum]MBB6143673.1 glycosyltransferase involved in cell wall biosynthesis [Silvibacterium bohemicum]
MINPVESLAEQPQLSALPESRGRWVHALTHLDPKYGGLSAAVPQLASSLALAHGFSIDIAAFTDPEEDATLPQHPEVPVSTWSADRKRWFPGATASRRFRDQMRGAAGVHIHGLWEASTNVSAHTARSLRIPYVVSAHGMLEPWALANKGFKKRIYANLIERENVNGAACLHALTRAEAQNYRTFGSRRSIAIIPNGVRLPHTIDGSIFYHRFPNLRGQRIVLFLGRIHLKKGLRILIESWAKVATRFPDATLVLAGPDCENSLSALQELIAGKHITNRVVFTGMLVNEMKWSALASAHAFVLPSYSEGLSVATLEAMGMGLPVIISEQCHLPEVKDRDTGWIVQTDASSLETALDNMLSNSPAVNGEIGNRGRRLIHERYNWKAVSRQMAELYLWIAGGNEPHTFELLKGRR